MGSSREVPDETREARIGAGVGDHGRTRIFHRCRLRPDAGDGIGIVTGENCSAARSLQCNGKRLRRVVFQRRRMD